MNSPESIVASVAGEPVELHHAVDRRPGPTAHGARPAHLERHRRRKGRRPVPRQPARRNDHSPEKPSHAPPPRPRSSCDRYHAQVVGWQKSRVHAPPIHRARPMDRPLHRPVHLYKFGLQPTVNRVSEAKASICCCRQDTTVRRASSMSPGRPPEPRCGEGQRHGGSAEVAA